MKSINYTQKILQILNEHPEVLTEWGYENPEEITDGLVFAINTCRWHPGWIRVEYEEADGTYFIIVRDTEYGYEQEVGFVQESELFDILDKVAQGVMTEEEIEEIRRRWWSMDHDVKPFPVMTIDGLHYIKSVIVSDNPYELTLLCDTLWEGELFEVPATVVHEGLEYKVTGIDVGQSSQLENLRELRIPSTVRHIFPEACVGIKSLRKVNIPDHCRVHSGAFAECGIEELILGENVILEEACFEGIRAKQVNIPETTKWSPYRYEDYEDEFDSYEEPLTVSADSMDDIIGNVFRYSIWHYMEILERARKGEKWAIEEFARGVSSHSYSFSPDEILNLLDENEKHWISQFEDARSSYMSMSLTDEELPF